MRKARPGRLRCVFVASDLKGLGGWLDKAWDIDLHVPTREQLMCADRIREALFRADSGWTAHLI